MKMKRTIAAVLLFALLLSGCANGTSGADETTTGETFNTTVDKNQIISVISPEQNGTVSLITDELTEIIGKYALGMGQLYNDKAVTLGQDVEFSWSCSEESNGYTLVYTTNSDFSDAVSVDTDTASVSVADLYAGTTYHWQVITHTADGDNYSSVYTFTTAQTPRIISLLGVNNTRDAGGYVTEDGLHRVKQGMIYRGAKLDAIEQAGIAKAVEVYNIKTELDLRSTIVETDFVAPEVSYLGESVNYVNIAGTQYYEVFSNPERMYEQLSLFTDEANYPIYIHCSAGKDRTGTLVFIINALLGVPENQLYLDYEMTYLRATGFDSSGYTGFVSFLDRFKQFEGETFQEKAEAYCASIGFTDEQIASIRSIMLEEIN